MSDPEFEGEAKKNVNFSSQGQGQGHKNWPQGVSSPKSALEDYVTALYGVYPNAVTPV